MDTIARVVLPALVFCLAGAPAWPQSVDLDLDSNARVRGGLPALVTVSTAPLSVRGGTLHVGARTVSSRYRYDESGQLVEWVYYEGSRAVEYSRFTYDQSHRVASRTTKTAASCSTSWFSYAPNKSIEVFQPDDPAPAGWTEREQLRAQGSQTVSWVRSFDVEGTLTRASRTTRDSAGRALETISYGEDGTVQEMQTFRYETAQVIERRVARGRGTAAGSARPTETESVTRTAFECDGRGNWVQSTSYRLDGDRQQFGALQPITRTFRDIAWREAAPLDGPSPLDQSIEPAQLFPRAQQQ